MKDTKLAIAVLLLAIVTSFHGYVIFDLNNQIDEHEQTIIELQKDVAELNATIEND